jgi:hypothetical protein
MNYKVNHNGRIYEVIETKTELIIETYRSSKEARRVCRSLNLGCGFNGHTPKFFIDFNPSRQQKRRLNY